MQTSTPLAAWIFSFAEAEPEVPPEDLTTLDDAALEQWSTRFSSQFDELYATEGVISAAQLAQLEELAGHIERLGAESTRRAGAAADARTAADALAARIRPPAEPDPTVQVDPPAADPPAVTEPVAAAVEPAPAFDPEALALAVATAVTTALHPEPAAGAGSEGGDPDGTVVAAGGDRIPAADLLPHRRRLNIPLSELRNRAPDPELPRPEIAMVASADIAGFSTGGSIENLDQIVQAFQARSRILPVTTLGVEAPRYPVMTIQRTHQHLLNEDSTPEQVETVLRAITDVEAMVAAGGWCAPSQIIYELFNIAAADGLLDLPTVGITRGGMRFPIDSPTLADVLGNVWLWTEEDDRAATGTASGSPRKPCFRVPCPTFDEERLDAWGICVTAGNLTERAYPEIVVNFIKLMVAAHFHVMNRARIDAVASGSTPLTMASPGDGAAANMLTAVELGAIDYREKYGMEDDAVLEVVFPRWADGVFRADLSRRSGGSPDDAMNVSDEQIAAWFDRRDVRVQWVADYQSRDAGGAGTATPGATAGLTAWPEIVKFLLYPAGTWVLGEGGGIDLGAQRDSVLNATNDHTAAWSEEFYLTAKLGHESREYTVAIEPDGSVGDRVTITNPVA